MACFAHVAAFSAVLLLAAFATPCLAQRRLKQVSVQSCALLHPACVSCDPRTENGVSTRLVCTACTAPQYKAINGSCGCSPSYFAVNDTYCGPCSKGSFCPGGLGFTAASISCGPELTTTQGLAADAAACITLPGFAFMSGIGTAVECPAGTYNTGGNQRNCTQCSAGLTTSGTGSTNSAACAAPPGYFYRNRQALPCSKGAYKGGINKDTACKACPAGTTTHSPAATTAADCTIVLPGYRPLFDASGQAIGAQPCPIGTFSLTGRQCDPCSSGLTTQGPKQTTDAACLAPPGFGYYPNKLIAVADASNSFTAASLNDSSEAATAAVVACPSGSYKSGWNLDSCTSCGVGLLTDPISATSSDNCFLPPGYGSKLDANSSTAANSSELSHLIAERCTKGTYGSESKTYGLEPRPCQACPEHTATPDMDPATTVNTSILILTSIADCSNIPGYGWQHGVASQCAAGYYSPGFDLSPCTECGDGLITNKPLATRLQDCVAQPGWELVNAGAAQPCETGSYSPGGPIRCQACPQGSTTAGPAATAATDCTICLPGWGSSSNQATSSQDASLCTPCTPGFYSAGNTADTCTACDPGFTSRVGATDSNACYAQWSSFAPYNCLATAGRGLVAAGTSATGAGNVAVSVTATAPQDSDSCQAACGAHNGCQFWIFRARQLKSADNGCWLKLQPALPAPNTYVSYKLGTGEYATWPADQDSDAQLGNSAVWTSPDGSSDTTPSACLDACDQKAACLGTWLAFNITSTSWTCKLMAGEFRDGVSSSIQAVPQRIGDNRWAKDCIGSWVVNGQCDKECGGGVQQETYSIIQPAMEDGAPCEAVAWTNRTQACNKQPCVGIDSATAGNATARKQANGTDNNIINAPQKSLGPQGSYVADSSKCCQLASVT